MEFGSTALMFALIKLLGMKNLWFSDTQVTVPPMQQIEVIEGFKGPYGLHVFDDGTLYVADAVGGYAVRYSRDLVRMGTLGSPTDAEFPHFVERDAMNRLLVPDHRNSWIKRYYEDGTFIDMFSTGNADIALMGPVHVFTNEAGTTFITDYHAHRILKFDPDGTFAGWIGERADESLTDGWTMTGASKESAKPGGFTQPHMVAQDRVGNLYIADTGNHRIQKFSADGKFLGFTGGMNVSATSGWLKTGTTILGRTVGFFNRPTAITFAKGQTPSEDYLIVADTENERLQRIAMDGNAIGWMGGIEGGGVTMGWESIGLSRIGAELGAFHNPFYAQLFEGKLYVADTGNKRVQIIPLNN